MFFLFSFHIMSQMKNPVVVIFTFAHGMKCELAVAKENRGNTIVNMISIFVDAM